MIYLLRKNIIIESESLGTRFLFMNYFYLLNVFCKKITFSLQKELLIIDNQKNKRIVLNSIHRLLSISNHQKGIIFVIHQK